jgi:hypothetical protein
LDAGRIRPPFRAALALITFTSSNWDYVEGRLALAGHAGAGSFGAGDGAGDADDERAGIIAGWPLHRILNVAFVLWLDILRGIPGKEGEQRMREFQDLMQDEETGRRDRISQLAGLGGEVILIDKT